MYIATNENRVAHGDVFRSLEFKYINEDDSQSSVTFPFWVVLTQDCDLEHDFNSSNGDYQNNDKNLQTILVCPAYVSDQLKVGAHMQQLSWQMATWGGESWKNILKNNNYRFHYMPDDKDNGLPELVLDFKRFFTLPRDYVYSNIDKRVVSIDTLYKESLSQRFVYYLSRIALPDSSIDS